MRPTDPLPPRGMKRDEPTSEFLQLKKRIAELEQVVVSSLSAIGGRTEDGPPPGPMLDAKWNCEKCRSLLAFYDKEQDVLRIRYKEHVCFVRLGEGGWIQVVCKSCSHPNEQKYVTQEEADVGQEEATARAALAQR